MVLGGSLLRQNLMPLARPAVLSAGLEAWTDGDGAKRTKWVITDTEIGVSLRFTTVEVARDRREQPASPN